MVCASCLVLVVALVSEAGSRPAATRFLLSCQKKPGKEKARLAGGWSGGTRCAPAALRSNNRRKYVGTPEVGYDACAHLTKKSGVFSKHVSGCYMKLYKL